MKPHRLAAGLFALAAAAQLAVPASQVFRYEQTLRDGKVYKFRCAPVDPYDAFRGRYVALSYEDPHVPWTEGPKPETGEKVYATIQAGADGFAIVTAASRKAPASGDYLKLEVQYPYDDQVRLHYPFEQFYMEEKLAPKADTAYRQHSVRAVHDAYAAVRVLGGTGAIEQVYVGNQTLAEAARDAAPQ